MKINLEDINKKNPYQVPDNYFESLTSEIQEKVALKKQSRFSFDFSIKLALAPAFMLVLLAGFWFYSIEDKTTPNSEALLSGVSSSEMLDYLDEEELSINELISLTSNPSGLIDENPTYLKGLDLEKENIDELINSFDLNEIYL